jgi:hypothetical protein
MNIERKKERSMEAIRMRRFMIAFLIAIYPAAALAGLDVTAYSELVEVPNAAVDKDGIPTAKDMVRLSPVDYPERFKGLKPQAIYRFKKQFDFRAGSYSGYNWWRNELAKLAGYKPIEAKTVEGKTESRYDAAAWKAKSGPFWELINFSDAEGVIGPVVCKKLYADFVANHKAAMAHPSKDFQQSYLDWEKALELASKNGALEFH